MSSFKGIWIEDIIIKVFSFQGLEFHCIQRYVTSFGVGIEEFHLYTEVTNDRLLGDNL